MALAPPAGLWRRQDGVSALEMALLLPVFLFLVFGVIQVGLLLLTQSVLDVATHDGARLIETGQVQQGAGVTTFQTALCAVFSGGLFDCDQLRWTVSSGSTFQAITTSSGLPSASSFSPGSADSRVVVQVFYTQTLLLPLVADVLNAGNGVVLSSTVALQNGAYE